MSLPSTHALERVIVDILSSARDDGRLNQLTVRIVRQQLATHFDLEENVLNSEPYKTFIKTTVRATVDSLQSGTCESAPPPLRKPTKKGTGMSGGATKSGMRKSSKKAQVDSSDEAPPAPDTDAPAPKKASARSKSAKALKKPESKLEPKSKAIIESSDDEAAPVSEGQTTAKPTSKQEQARSPKQHEADKEGSDVEMDSVRGPGPSGSSSKPGRAAESPKASMSRTKGSTGEHMESELSSVVDEPPKKRQKKQEKESTKPRKDETMRQGKKKEILSKDEETINRLKAIVVACGVRKVWKKEFEGLDKSSQQIKRLHSILGDLGMTPRYSLEKARAIRERRELAQELKDVQEFEKATKRGGKAHHRSSETDGYTDQTDDDGDVPAPKKRTARASIMAFLQDQSDEE